MILETFQRVFEELREQLTTKLTSIISTSANIFFEILKKSCKRENSKQCRNIFKKLWIIKQL